MTPGDMAQLHARGMEYSRPWTALEFTDLLSSKLIFSQTTQNAFALGRVVADEAELLTIVVDPNARRAGVGKTLLNAFETEARRRGASIALLDVSADNIGAIRLYEASGWKEVGRRADYYRSGASIADAILMNKHLKI